MSVNGQKGWYWLIALLFLIGLLWLLGDILFPFVAGMALAYLFDPLLDKLEQWKIPRWVGAATLTLFSVLAVFSSILLIMPLLHTQILEFGVRLPSYLSSIQAKVLTLIATFQPHFTETDISTIKKSLTGLIN